MLQELFHIPLPVFLQHFFARPYLPVYGYGAMLVIGFLLPPHPHPVRHPPQVPLLTGSDIMAPCIMIGLAFGRIGCYLNGCCYGEECNLPWGAAFPYGSNAFVEQFEKNEIDVPPQLLKKEPSGRFRLLTKTELQGKPDLEKLADSLRSRPVHPTELYSSFNAFFIAAILLVFFSLT